MRLFEKALGVALIGLSACTSVSDEVVQEVVVVRSFSGLSGSTQYAMSSDGLVTISIRTAGIPEAEITQRQGASSFAEVVAVARDAIAAVGPVSGEVCLDYGTDSVEVRQGGRVTDSVSVACPDDDVERAQRLVRAAMLDGAE